MNKFTRVSVLFAAVALTALAGCASTQKHESTGQYLDDTVDHHTRQVGHLQGPGPQVGRDQRRNLQGPGSAERLRQLAHRHRSRRHRGAGRQRRELRRQRHAREVKSRFAAGHCCAARRELAGCAGMSTRDKNVVGAAIGGVAGAVLTGGSAIGTVGGAAWRMIGNAVGNDNAAAALRFFRSIVARRALPLLQGQHHDSRPSAPGNRQWQKHATRIANPLPVTHCPCVLCGGRRVRLRRRGQHASHELDGRGGGRCFHGGPAASGTRAWPRRWRRKTRPAPAAGRRATAAGSSNPCVGWSPLPACL